MQLLGRSGRQAHLPSSSLLFFHFPLKYLFLSLDIFVFAFNLSLISCEELDDLSDYLVIFVHNKVLHRVAELAPELLYLPLNQAPVEMHPGFVDRVRHVTDDWVEDRKILPLSIGYCLFAQDMQEPTDHDPVLQLPLISSDEQHLVGLAVIDAVLIVNAHIVLDEEEELIILDFHTGLLLALLTRMAALFNSQEGLIISNL
jgi:hypothetical protein